jgi:hypothetical protein
LASVVQPTDRAFAWAVIGPAESASAGYLLQRFQGFYKELLKTGDGEAALAYLRSKDGLPGPKCYVASAYGLFRASYENYLRDHCTPEQYRVRARRSVMGADRIGKSISEDDLFEHLTNSEERNFLKMRDHFFMMDIYPDNVSRFPVDYLECVDVARK